jgi:hypothetical protein
MNAAMCAKPVMICCAVFEAEVKALWKNHWPDIVIRFQNSMLHMRPAKLATRLELLIEEELAQEHQVVLIYGDCCLQMTALVSRPGVVRTRGNNCCAMFLGRDEYRRFSREGAFFLFPEWTHRWRHIFTVELGLNQENATSLMSDMHRKLVYLDTGVVPVPIKDLQECSQYCGLPYEVHQVSLEPLRVAIEEALHELEITGDA